MSYLQRVHDFAVKWLNKFEDKGTGYLELVEHYMADDCAALGFTMDCGYAFSEKYGSADSDHNALRRFIDDVIDVPLLGSAIYSRWRYFNHWAYSGDEILEPENRMWFIMALNSLAELSVENPFVFRGVPRKIKIVSNNVCYGPPPEPGEEVEQRLTITSNGRVWFSAYDFGIYPELAKKIRSKSFAVKEPVAQKVLHTVAAYFGVEREAIFVTDIGDWNLEITNSDGRSFKYRGSLCEDLVVGGIGLSDLIRTILGDDSLFVFDGARKQRWKS